MSILDACCGSRMFWFDREDERVTFMDIRIDEVIVELKREVESAYEEWEGSQL